MAKIKIINDKGEEEEIEAFSQSEVDAKVKETEEQFNGKIKEKEDAMVVLQKEKEELAGKIGGIKEDHPNFKILKDALSKKDQEIKDINDKLSKDTEERKVGSLITKFSKGNQELEKKIKFHLDNTVSGMKSDTLELLEKKIDAALKLSQDFNNQNIFDSGINNGGGNGGGNGGNNNTGGVEFNAREIAIGEKLGITAEDRKKYGPKLK